MSEAATKAHDAIIKARTVLLVTQPFFGCLSLHLELVENTTFVPTMAVDGIHMFYNPEFVNKLSEPELLAVVAHEVLHCAYLHFSRRGHRDPIIWNCAGDYIINNDLKKASFTLPGQPVGMKELNDPNNKTIGHLYDPQFDGMSSEEVYERIKQAVEKRLDKMKGQGVKFGKGGDGDGSQVIDIGGCGGVMDTGGAGDKHAQGNAQREWDANVRMAVNIAKRANAGTTPGYLERLVKQLAEPKVSWRDLTRQFIDNSMSKDYSWSRPNRRHIHAGLILPGFISDALHHMIFVVDTSGSVDGDMLKAMVSEISGALNDGTADKLTVVYADTKVQHVDEWVPGDLVTAKIHGGGGTAFADSFRWIKENAPDAQCIVYLTDMMTSEWGEDVGIPTMWAAYLPKNMLANITPPFGTVISVDTSE